MHHSAVLGYRVAASSVVATAFLLLTLALQAVPAYADPHPAIEPRRLALNEPVQAGAREALPPLSVTNSGDSAGSFVVEVRSFTDPAATPEEAAWLDVEPAAFDLGPGETREVTITVAPGEGAAVRDYRTLVTAGTADGAVAVATTIEFGVGAPSADAAATTDMSLYIIVAGLAALAVGLVVFARRFQLDLDTMRRRRSAAVPVAEPSRSVLLVPPPVDESHLTPEGALEPAVEIRRDASATRPWMSEFTEAQLEVPRRPSVEAPAVPLAQMPSQRTERAVQVPLPPPLQPSRPPAPSTVVPTSETEAANPPPRGAQRPSQLPAAAFALGAVLALWATVATVMLATRPSVDRDAIDEQITALEARVESLTALVDPDRGTPPHAALGDATATPAAGAPPTGTPTSEPTPEATTEATPEAPAAVVTEAPEPVSTPTPEATSQAVEAEPVEEPTPEPTEVVTGGEAWVPGADGERVYVAGPAGGPLDTAGADLYDCHHFEAWAQALAVREASGPDDPNLIDTDGNGLPCESLMAREQAG